MATISVTHPFVSAKPDSNDAAKVNASNWNAAHTFTMANGTVAGRRTTGAGAAEEVSFGLGMLFNVKDYGAVGNGSTDDTAAIQSAVTAAIAVNGAVYFPIPSVSYKITDTIDINSDCYLFGDGDGSFIDANFSGYMFERITPGLDYGPLRFARLRLRNTHASGSCIFITHTVGSSVRECSLQCDVYCVHSDNNFSTTVDTCVLRAYAAGAPSTSRGVLTAGHTLITGCDFAGLERGVQGYGPNSNVIGCRFEVNETGILLGKNAADSDSASSRTLIAGNTFEANDTGIYLYHVSCSTLSGNGMQGSVNAPSTQSIYGLRCHNIGTCLVNGFIANGSFSTAAIAFDSNPTKSVFIGVQADNT